MKKALSILGLAACMSSPAFAVEKGEILASTCFSCHGYDGKNTGASIIPLGEYPASLIVSQMKAFKNDTRIGTVMNRHAKGYTDEEIELMAKFIGKQGL